MKSVVLWVLVGVGAMTLLSLKADTREMQVSEESKRVASDSPGGGPHSVVEPLPDAQQTEPVDTVSVSDPVVLTAPIAAVEAAGGAALTAKTAQVVAQNAAEKAAKTATKTGVKVAATSALKGVPVVGWGLAAADVLARGWDGESFSASNIVESVQQDIQDLAAYGQMFIDDPVETVKATANAVGDLGQDGVKAVQNAVGAAVGTVTDAVETAASGVVDVVSSVTSFVQDLVHVDVPKWNLRLPKLW